MSHTTFVKNVKIDSTRAVQSAVETLIMEGVNVCLEYNVTMRNYYEDQLRRTGRKDEVVDICLRLPQGPYDVGLLAQPDGTFVPAFDSHGGYVASHLGTDKSPIGRFLELYTLHKTTQDVLSAQGFYDYSVARNEQQEYVVTINA